MTVLNYNSVSGRVLAPFHPSTDEEGCQSFNEPALSALLYNQTPLLLRVFDDDAKLIEFMVFQIYYTRMQLVNELPRRKGREI